MADKTLPQVPEIPVMPPAIQAINDRMKPLFQQLGILYSRREKTQKAIDEVETRLDALKDALVAVQQKEV